MVNPIYVSIPGAAGANAYTNTASNFVVPAIGATVVVSVLNSACFVVGEYVIAAGPAHFLVTAITSSTSVTLQFLAYPNDVAAGSTILSGVEITPADGPSGMASYTTALATITLPIANAQVGPISVVNSAWMAVGQTVVAGDGTHLGTFKVYAKSAGAVTLTWINAAGDSTTGTVIAIGAVISPIGVPVLSNPVPLAQGGTGLNVATNALLLTGLGAAANSNNSDITQLSGITTPLSLAQGGTAATTAAAALAGLITAGKVGTFVCNGVTPVTVNNVNITANSVVIVCLKTVGGTVGAVPAVKTITPGGGFTIAGTASDSSTYNFIILN